MTEHTHDADPVALIYAMPREERADYWRWMMERPEWELLPVEVREAVRMEVASIDTLDALTTAAALNSYGGCDGGRGPRKALDLLLGEGAHAAFVLHLYRTLRDRAGLASAVSS